MSVNGIDEWKPTELRTVYASRPHVVTKFLFGNSVEIEGGPVNIKELEV